MRPHCDGFTLTGCLYFYVVRLCTIVYYYSMLMSVSEARSNMREALQRVKAGEEIELTQNGEIVAVWIHPSRLKMRIRTENTVAAENLLEMLNTPMPGLLPEPVLQAEQADQWVKDIRQDRDAR